MTRGEHKLQNEMCNIAGSSKCYRFFILEKIYLSWDFLTDHPSSSAFIIKTIF